MIIVNVSLPIMKWYIPPTASHYFRGGKQHAKDDYQTGLQLVTGEEHFILELSRRIAKIQ